jgi:hypothetical protein
MQTFALEKTALVLLLQKHTHIKKNQKIFIFLFATLFYQQQHAHTHKLGCTIPPIDNATLKSRETLVKVSGKSRGVS